MYSDTLTERVTARGHEHVTATHASTFEVTTDDWLTPAGDCILGVRADRTPSDFSEAFVRRARGGARITVALSVGAPNDDPGDIPASSDARQFVVTGRGDSNLTFESDRSLVCRTSEYTDDRTVAVGCDTAAAGIDREIVEQLADGAPLRVDYHAHPPE